MWHRNGFVLETGGSDGAVNTLLILQLYKYGFARASGLKNKSISVFQQKDIMSFVRKVETIFLMKRS
jgi:hypothetical protein